eukprot:scaffold389752_cov30-Prasinocladus_malaysianus.AAC.1
MAKKTASVLRDDGTVTCWLKAPVSAPVHEVTCASVHRRFARTKGRSRWSQRCPRDSGGRHDGSDRASPALKDPTGRSQLLKRKLSSYRRHFAFEQGD